MMSSKDYCLAHPPFAYYNLLPGEIIYIHGFDYGSIDYAYISDNYGDVHKYHRLRIVPDNNESFYIILHNTRLYLDNFVVITEGLNRYKDKRRK